MADEQFDAKTQAWINRGENNRPPKPPLDEATLENVRKTVEEQRQAGAEQAPASLFDVPAGRPEAECEADREAFAPASPRRSALGTSRATDNVTGAGPKAFGNPRPDPTLGGARGARKGAFNDGHSMIGGADGPGRGQSPPLADRPLEQITSKRPARRMRADGTMAFGGGRNFGRAAAEDPALNTAQELEEAPFESWRSTDRGADSVLGDSLGSDNDPKRHSGQIALEIEVQTEAPSAPNLVDRFLVPSFTVLDTRQDYWKKRREAWLKLGMRGETTAEHDYVPGGGTSSVRSASGVYAGQGNESKLKAERRPALNTSADEHEAHGQNAARRHAAEKLAGGARDVDRGAIQWPHRAVAAGGSEQRDNESGGRRRELIYTDTAPGGDPGFYSKKRAVEERINEARRQEGLEPITLTTEEFLQSWYAGRESESEAIKTGTSVFDPMLCEIAYRWFSAPGHRVLDPFAGGVVRGLVAGALGRAYTGIELRPEQIADNREQAERLFDPASGIAWGRTPVMPIWHEHDATALGDLGMDPVDLVFTCPPYADLEVYSDDPRDLSTMSYEAFRDALAAVIRQSAERLRDNRFAVWVVGEARGGAQTAEYGLVADTIKSAQAAGLALYNSAILVNSVGSAALRAQMILRTRKLTRVHQHVLVFLKGDHKKAAQACGDAALDK